MADLKKQIAITALNDMMSRGHFSICTIDSVAELLGVNAKGEAYTMLRALHCVDWAKMPQDVRAAVPDLIRDCLGVGPVFRFKTLEPEVIDVAPAKRRGFMRMLG